MSLESLSLDTTALLAVDMQNAFCHPEGTLGISGVDVRPAQATIEPVRRLVEAPRVPHGETKTRRRAHRDLGHGPCGRAGATRRRAELRDPQAPVRRLLRD